MSKAPFILKVKNLKKLITLICGDIFPEFVKSYENGLALRTYLDFENISLQQLADLNYRIQNMAVDGMGLNDYLFRGDLSSDGSIYKNLTYLVNTAMELQNKHFPLINMNKDDFAIHMSTIAEVHNVGMDFVKRHVHRPTVLHFINLLKNDKFPPQYAYEKKVAQLYVAMYAHKNFENFRNLGIELANDIMTQGDLDLMFKSFKNTSNRLDKKKLELNF